MKYYIAFDTETGGIGDDKSLLTAYFGLFKYDKGIFVKIDELDLKIKPDDDVYRVTAESLHINQIDLKSHNVGVIYQRKAGTMLYDKISNWYKTAGDKLIPIGHNVAFDIRKVTTTLVSVGSWEQYVSYRLLDTCTIAQFLRISGKLPSDLSCSLVNLGEYFNVQVDGLPHEAKYDALVTVGVLNNLLKL
jgi:DNA polymerase III alpha subunit (gram-positive type)